MFAGTNLNELFELKVFASLKEYDFSSSGSSSNSFENNKVSSTNDNSEQWEPKPWLTSSGSSLNVTLTPSESTSELSVLSVNSHLTSSVVNPAVRKTTMVINRSLKPSASTGAIPKSISFDMSVNKGLEDDSRWAVEANLIKVKNPGIFSRSKRGGFFGRLRKGFGYKKRSFRNQEDLRNGDEDFLVKQAIGDSPIRLNNSASGRNLHISRDVRFNNHLDWTWGFSLFLYCFAPKKQ